MVKENGCFRPRDEANLQKNFCRLVYYGKVVGKMTFRLGDHNNDLKDIYVVI